MQLLRSDDEMIITGEVNGSTHMIRLFPPENTKPLPVPGTQGSMLFLSLRDNQLGINPEVPITFTP